MLTNADVAILLKNGRLLVAKGTAIDVRWDGAAGAWRPREAVVDLVVELEIVPSDVAALVGRAVRNRTRKATAGPVRVRVYECGKHKDKE